MILCFDEEIIVCTIVKIHKQYPCQFSGYLFSVAPFSGFPRRLNVIVDTSFLGKCFYSSNKYQFSRSTFFCVLRIGTDFPETLFCLPNDFPVFLTINELTGIFQEGRVMYRLFREFFQHLLYLKYLSVLLKLRLKSGMVKTVTAIYANINFQIYTFLLVIL